MYLKNSRMKGLLESRNRSILAHGFSPVGKGVAEKLLAEVERFSKDMVEKYGKVRESARFGIMSFS